MQFSRCVSRDLVLSCSAKKVVINDLDFRQKPKNWFLPHFRNYWMIQIFPRKSSFVGFFPLLFHNSKFHKDSTSGYWEISGRTDDIECDNEQYCFGIAENENNFAQETKSVWHSLKIFKNHLDILRNMRAAMDASPISGVSKREQ
jgi:hypothetical protein